MMSGARPFLPYRFMLLIFADFFVGYSSSSIIFIIIIIIIIIIIVFISSWYKIVKNTNKNQAYRRYDYSFHATLHIKKMQNLIYL